MEDVLPRCGAFAASLKLAPKGIRARLRAQLAAVVAASFRADQTSVTTWARRSTGPHPLLPFLNGVARMESIVAGVARGSGGEWAILGRAGAPAVITALSLGAAADRTIADFERAHAAAVELALRFRLATLLAPDCVPAVAAAVSAAVMLGLSAEQTAHAIARALSLSSALDGVVAAELAFDGATWPWPSLAKGPFARLGDAWLASTIQIDAHDAPASAQSAIDGAHEVFAQARAVRRAPLRPDDVRSLEIETTVFGATMAVDFGVPRERVRVRHSWDLTSALLFRVAESVDARSFFNATAARDLASAVIRTGVDVPSLAQIVGDVTRMLSMRSSFDPRPVMLGNRVHLTIHGGQRFSADRSDPASHSPMATARARLIDAAKHLGKRRAERLCDAIESPPPGMRVRELLALVGGGV